MTIEELDKIRFNKKWPFKIGRFFERYFLVIFPLGISIVSFSMIKSGIINNDIQLKTIGSTTFILVFFITILFLKTLYNNHFFKSYIIENLTIEKIETSLNKCRFENFHYYKLGYYEIITEASWFSWGGLITIIPNGNELLINYKSQGLNGVNLPYVNFRDKKKLKELILFLNSDFNF